MFERPGRGLFFVGVIGALFLWASIAVGVKFGIDLSGGTELTYTVNIFELDSDRRATALEDTKRIIEDRFNQYGLREFGVTPRGVDSLVIQISSTDNEEIARFKQSIEKAGQLTLHLVAQDASTAARVDEIRQETDKWREEIRRVERLRRQNPDQTYAQPVAPERIAVRMRDESEGYIVVENTEPFVMSGDDLVDSKPTFDNNGFPAVGFEFGGPSKTKLANITTEYANEGQLAIVLDGICHSAPSINGPLRDGSGIIQGGGSGFEQGEVDDLVTLLRSGSLPVSPVFDSESRVGSLLGLESIRKGQVALSIAFLAIIVFLVFYYRLALGGVAAMSLLYNLLVVYSLLVIFQNELTLPGLAGFLLTVGMAVDANILIFERIREERKRGRSLMASIENGYGKAFSTIFDANLTTLITAFILFRFGSGPVKGFAIVLSIGIFASFFSSIYVSRLLLTAIVKSGLVQDFKMMAAVRETSINFLVHKKRAAILSVILIGGGLLTLTLRNQEALGIDFTGGTRLVVNMREPVKTSEFTDRIEETVSGNVRVQPLDEVEGASTSFSIRTREVVTGEAREQQKNAVKQRIEAALKGELAPAMMLISDAAPPGIFARVIAMRAGPQKPALETDDVREILEAGTGANRDGTDRPFPVGSVEKSTPIGTWSRFVISATETGSEQSLEALEEHLSSILTAVEKTGEVRLSDPFPEVSTIGSRVARDLQSKVFTAMLIAFAAIIFYISLRFEFKFGLAAIVALVHDIAFTLGALAVGDLLLGNFVNLKINLPVVAGLLTVVGYSLNDTIVIFDRIRENLEGKRRTADWNEVVNRSINNTLSRTVLTSITTFAVTAILLIGGGEGLQGFAFSLCMGILVGTYSSLYVASPALLYFHKRSEVRRERVLAEAAAG